MTEALKRCPFCRGEIVCVNSGTIAPLEYHASAGCRGCGAQGPYARGHDELSEALDEAINLWNRRADLPAAVTVKPLVWEKMDAFAWVAHGLVPAEYHISTDDCGKTWDFQEFYDPEESPDFSGPFEDAKAHVQKVHERRILSCLTTQPVPVKDAARVLLRGGDYMQFAPAFFAMDECWEEGPEAVFFVALRALAEQEQSE